MKNVIKKCRCNREYTANTWKWLPLVGTQITDEQDGPYTCVYSTEMRNCLCGSTIAVETVVIAPVAVSGE